MSEYQIENGQEIILDDDHLRVSCNNNDGPFCVVSFTGIGHGLNGIDLQTREFTALSPELGPNYFVIDKTRSWGNAIDLEAVCKVIRDRHHDKRIITLGNSMGGFLAILASQYIGAERCISFSPQYSVSPKVVPFEKRWKKYSDKIDTFKFESLSHAFCDETEYFIFFGNRKSELRHMNLFPDRRNVRKILAGRDHNLARELKQSGLLYPLISECFMDTPDISKFDFNVKKVGLLHRLLGMLGR